MLNAGNPVTKATVDAKFGGLAVRFPAIMAEAAQANAWLADATDLDLTGLGYEVGDITALRDAAYAYGILTQVYAGATNLPTAMDFTTAIEKLAGLA